MIDEIKSTSGDLGVITEHVPGSLGAGPNVRLYVHKRHEIPKMAVRLTYFQVPSGEAGSCTGMELRSAGILRLGGRGGLRALCQPLCGAWRAEGPEHPRMEVSVSRLPRGTAKIAGAVYKSIGEGRRLFAKAPTGIGKTISTLFPSVKAIGEGLLSRIFI